MRVSNGDEYLKERGLRSLLFLPFAIFSIALMKVKTEKEVKMIICMETASWANEYGYDEEYILKEMTVRKSGHLRRGSAMETDDSCGNCDGGRCDSCTDIYEVFGFSELKPHIDPEYGCDYYYQDTLVRRIFDNEEEAKEFYDGLTL